jgi:hypothetical protein
MPIKDKAYVRDCQTDRVKFVNLVLICSLLCDENLRLWEENEHLLEQEQNLLNHQLELGKLRYCNLRHKMNKMLTFTTETGKAQVLQAAILTGTVTPFRTGLKA